MVRPFDICEVKADLRKCWSKSTSFSKDAEDGKSTGQCYVTALLIAKYIGGKVMHGWIKINGKRLHHFWNFIDLVDDDDPNIGIELDFTSDQYGGDGVHPVIKGEIFEKPNFNNKRFLKLEKKYIGLYKQEN